MTTAEIIEQKTKNFVDHICGITNLNGYNVRLSIEPKEDPNFKPTGEVDLETIRSWKTTETDSDRFTTVRKTNGNGYYYRGKLTTTVK